MRTKNILPFILALTILFSCNQNSEQNKVSLDNLAPPEIEITKFTPPKIVKDEEVRDLDNATNEILGNNTSLNKKKIIKDGNISIKTNEINSSKKVIDGYVKKMKAYYESEDLQNNDESTSYELKIRVPADSFELLIYNIENGDNEIINKSVKARDITEEYIDIETRLLNKRTYLKKYNDLLVKASTVKDILAIEENIRKLQEEIESKAGKLKYLNDQVSFSTLVIYLYKEKAFVYKPQPQDKFFERVKSALSNGWSSVVNFVLWLIKIWPLFLLTFLVYFTIKRILKK